MSEIRYSIERTRNRTSRAVLRDGMIQIRLARGLPPAEEQRHIQSLLKRMSKAYLKDATKKRLDPFRSLFTGEQSVTTNLATGSLLSFRVQDGRRNKALQVWGGWSVLRGLNTDDRTFHRFLWKLLAKSAHKEIEALVRSINAETYNEHISAVTLKYMRSRWGSCSHTGVIALSTPLLFTTPEILRYVIIHELAHLQHPNHSAHFWQHVALHSPDHVRIRKLLLGFKLPKA